MGALALHDGVQRGIDPARQVVVGQRSKDLGREASYRNGIQAVQRVALEHWAAPAC